MHQKEGSEDASHGDETHGDHTDDTEDETTDEHDSLKRHHSTRGGPGLTQAQKDLVISLHNSYRRGEGASDMQQLKYNDKLASLAQEWSDRCNWGHRPPETFQASNYGFKTVGENIWAWSDSSKTLPDAPIKDWFDEKNNYDYNGPSCRKEPCGHYTAVVWSSTQEVGCGLTKCGTLNGPGWQNAIYFVCNYGPGGNDFGVKPFKKGAACSACSTGKFYCSDSLCDESCTSAGSGGHCECKASCGNGHATGDCKCQCNAGATGVSCSESCEDKNPMCGANPGWPEMFCTDKNAFGGMLYDQVNQNCPKMCGHCGSKKRSSDEAELLEVIETALDKKFGQ